ncbi:glycine cleavage system protein GcvH [Kurthia massiliensis]|uniref:glycine cleavage system protein GcvH n=1 Tax=Kurthia massiliensis TaxID=1033739 RepID=UPI000288DD23|nr:glycine cleavage system protein GcvH [Kurthia massiliensis]
MSVPTNLRYTEDHEWVKLEDGKAVIGITEFAQSELGDIVFVELPAVGDEIAAGDSFGSVESVKTVSELYLPIAGKVLEVNEALEDAPELVNESPYEQAWMVVIEPANEADVEALLTADQYKDAIAE